MTRWHHEIWAYCQSTKRAQAQIRQNLRVGGSCKRERRGEGGRGQQARMQMSKVGAGMREAGGGRRGDSQQARMLMTSQAPAQPADIDQPQLGCESFHLKGFLWVRSAET